MATLTESLKYAVEKVKAAASAIVPKKAGREFGGTAIDYAEDSTAIASASLDAALSEANMGKSRTLFSFASLMLEGNSAAAAHWGTRKNAVLGLDWSIVDSSTGGQSDDADTLRKALDSGALRQTLECVADAPFYGISGVMIDWDAEKKTPARVTPIHPTRWEFDLGGNPAILIPNEDGQSVATGVPTFPMGQVILATATSSAHPARAGLCRPLLWLHIFRKMGMETRARYIEKFGMPFLHGKMPQTQFDDETQRNTFLSMLRQAAKINAMVSPDNTELKIEGHTGAAANADHGKWIADIDNMIAQLILGQTGTSGDANGMSNGGAQTAVREDIRNADARRIAEALATQLLRPCAAFLGMSEPERFEFVFDLEPAADLAQKAVMVKTLSEAGYKADRAWVSETFAIPLQDEQTLSALPPAPAAFSDAATIGTRTQDIEALVSRASAAVASRAFGTVEEAAAMYRPIRAAVAKAFEGVDMSGDTWLEDGTARLASLSDTLPDAVRKMDWSAFTEALRRAQVGAAVAGYTE